MLKPNISSFIRFFASAEWSLFLLRTTGVIAFLSIGYCWVCLQGTPALNNSSGLACYQWSRLIQTQPRLVASDLILILSTLVSLHLLIVASIRNSKGISYASLSIAQALFALFVLTVALSWINKRHYEIQISEGETVNYLEVSNKYELAITQTKNPNTEGVYVINWSDLKENKSYQHPNWTFGITVSLRFNHAVFGNMQARVINEHGHQSHGISATHGYALKNGIKMFQSKATTPESSPALLVTITEPTRAETHTLLLTAGASPSFPLQSVKIKDETFSIQLRKQRFYPGYKLRIESDMEENCFLHEIDTNGIEIEKHPINYLKKANIQGLNYQLIPHLGSYDDQTTAIILSASNYPFFWVSITLGLLSLITFSIHNIYELRGYRKEDMG